MGTRSKGNKGRYKQYLRTKGRTSGEDSNWAKPPEALLLVCLVTKYRKYRRIYRYRRRAI